MAGKKQEMEAIKEDILKMLNSGMSKSEIAKKVNKSQSIVWRYLRLWQDGISYSNAYYKIRKEERENPDLNKKRKYTHNIKFPLISTNKDFCLDCADFVKCKLENWRKCPYEGEGYVVVEEKQKRRKESSFKK